MPKGTPTQLAQAIEAQADTLHSGEYLVPKDAKEILAVVGADPNPKLSKDAIERLFADVDEVKKAVVIMNERLAELKATKNGQAPAGGLDEPESKYVIGKMFKAVRDMMLYGKGGDILDKTTGYLEEGQGSMGGFTVAPEFIPELLMIPLQQSIMLPNAWVIPTATNSFSIPRIVDTTHESNVFGGVTGSWTAEGATISLSNPAFGACVLVAKKLALLTYVSNELLQDNAVGLDGVLRRMFGEAMAWFLDKGFIKGSGVNEPLGLTNAGCIDNINTTASHFYIEDAATMYSNMLPSSYERAIWLMSPSVIPDLLGMQAKAATYDNIWFSRGIITIHDDPRPWRLFGRPIFFTEFCAALGTSTDVMFIDPTAYIVLDRQNIVVDVSTEARFANDETGYRLKARYDGQPWVASKLTLADGATTVSPIVNSHHA